MSRVVRYWPKISRFGPLDYQIRFYPVGFCNIGVNKKPDPLFRSEVKSEARNRIEYCMYARISLTVVRWADM